jgi:hypothetical protein
MSDIEAVRIKITATEADIAEAKRIGDREYVIELTKYLSKLQDKENLLLGQKQESGIISCQFTQFSFNIILIDFRSFPTNSYSSVFVWLCPQKHEECCVFQKWII